MSRLGFGCMRLPMVGGPEGTVDQAQFNQMIDRYIAAGGRYFDTARVYLGGASETAMAAGITARYPRDEVFLVDKLSGSCFSTKEEILPLFESQLSAMGTDYFDLYLMHSLSREVYKKFTDLGAFETVAALMAAGKVRHMGISFHDKPSVLRQILTEHPEIEVVQIQLNYLDWDDPSVDSGGVYALCREFHKPIIVMEPVKGGALSDLPPAAAEVLSGLHGGSAASYALRFAATLPGVEMVLSGMSTTEQMEDNLKTFSALAPLSKEEQAAVGRVREIIRASNTIPCTACRYCVTGCPMNIPIPDLFACLNNQRKYQDWSSGFYYGVSVAGRGRAADCIRCGQCEKICPQHLPVSQLLQEVAAAFEETKA